jgi:hypothetical protein
MNNPNFDSIIFSIMSQQDKQPVSIQPPDILDALIAQADFKQNQYFQQKMGDARNFQAAAKMAGNLLG